ncbi:MAG: 23S rRNA (adenine(2503)-C2)-methyltransferase [delta proteobacterium ML8_F1]|nr:MAG: 23S rRNA (adenine(2503)-C2)-methyltransferase [delta proteobacterium ML8_F1]
MISIREYDLESLKEEMKRLGYPGFRGEQIFTWVHKRGVLSPEEMTNLPREIREKLEVGNMSLETEKVSQEDQTRKILYRLRDDHFVETVLMKYRYGNSLCISTQVGCRMGCAFCASTIGGLKRNLTAGEMLGQVYETNALLEDKINHVVLMGSGEPLENYDEVIKFLRIINHEKGYHLSLRNITLSTCGLIPEILKLADENLPVTLAISLHGASDETRGRLMPINRKYPIDELIRAVDYYILKTHRRVTFEYAMIKGVNDSAGEAHLLRDRLQGRLVHVNLIPVNAVEESGFFPSLEKDLVKFKSILEKKGINTTIRRELGSDINAACGQLRNTYHPAKVEIVQRH